VPDEDLYQQCFDLGLAVGKRVVEKWG
jgi:hypothetical protein